MNETTSLRGRVTGVAADAVTVSVERYTACDSCSASRLCMAGKSLASRHEVKASPVEGISLSVGDEVELLCRGGQGLRAALWAYVLPLAVLVVVLLLGVSLLGSEVLAALVSLAAVAVYYVLLHFARHRLMRGLRFEVRARVTV